MNEWVTKIQGSTEGRMKNWANVVLDGRSAEHPVILLRLFFFTTKVKR